jgi:hypothetical protein
MRFSAWMTLIVGPRRRRRTRPVMKGRFGAMSTSVSLWPGAARELTTPSDGTLSHCRHREFKVRTVPIAADQPRDGSTGTRPTTVGRHGELVATNPTLMVDTSGRTRAHCRPAAQARRPARHAPGVMPVQRRKARVNEVCSA